MLGIEPCLKNKKKKFHLNIATDLSSQYSKGTAGGCLSLDQPGLHSKSPCHVKHQASISTSYVGTHTPIFAEHGHCPWPPDN